MAWLPMDGAGWRRGLGGSSGRSGFSEVREMPDIRHSSQLRREVHGDLLALFWNRSNLQVDVIDLSSSGLQNRRELNCQ